MLRRTLLAGLALSASLTLTARADDPLPKGEDVLAQYVEATGGKAAYEKLKNRVNKGTIDVTGAGLKGTLTIIQAAPNKVSTVIELGQIGKTIEGTDGEVVWALSGLTGDRILTGEERQEKLLHATFNAEIHYKELYPKIECVGVENVDGKPAYKVTLTPKVGKPTTEYYDKASHLQVKSVATDRSPMGEITVETYPSDYKKVDGVLIAHKATQKVLTQEILLKIDEIKHNVDLPADTFAIPAAAKAMLNPTKGESK